MIEEYTRLHETAQTETQAHQEDEIEITFKSEREGEPLHWWRHTKAKAQHPKC